MIVNIPSVQGRETVHRSVDDPRTSPDFAPVLDHGCG